MMREMEQDEFQWWVLYVWSLQKSGKQFRRCVSGRLTVFNEDACASACEEECSGGVGPRFEEFIDILSTNGGDDTGSKGK